MKRLKPIKALLILALVGLLMVGLAVAVGVVWRLPDAEAECARLAKTSDWLAERLVVVDKAARVLCLLDHGRVEFSAPMSYGRAEGPKQVQGDLKTPEGRFMLAPARPSQNFGLFMHVGYPLPKHRKQAEALGKSPGGDVGVHGPHRLYAFSGVLQALFDHSAGCIVLDELAIHQLAKRVEKTLPIVILPRRPQH